MTLYVKKVWSWNPTQFKYIKLDQALKAYDQYLDYFKVEGGVSEAFKSFKEWLTTEI